ncbi:MAG: N4-gp56 family major capsid protein [Pseudomonadota bacterium]
MFLLIALLALIASWFFATAVVNESTDSELSEEFPAAFYDRVLLERAKPWLVHGQFGQMRPLPANNGKVLDFRKFNVFAPAVTALTEGSPGNGQQLNPTHVQATIAQYGDYVKGTDVLVLTAIDPILVETAEMLGDQAGLTLDNICSDVLRAGTTIQYANGRAGRAYLQSDDYLTVDEIRKAVRTLKRNKARPLPDGSYIGIVEPGATYDLQDDILWQDAAKYAGSTQLFSGEIGRIFGVRFIETNATDENDVSVALIDATSGVGDLVPVYGTLILGQNAYGTVPLTGGNLQFIFKSLGSAGAADPLNQVWTSGWKVMETYKILQELWILRIEHAMSG